MNYPLLALSNNQVRINLWFRFKHTRILLSKDLAGQRNVFDGLRVAVHRLFKSTFKPLREKENSTSAVQ